MPRLAIKYKTANANAENAVPQCGCVQLAYSVVRATAGPEGADWSKRMFKFPPAMRLVDSISTSTSVVSVQVT